MQKDGFAYIMASRGRRLYTGVTSQLAIRVAQHKKAEDPNSFTTRYNINFLVYYEHLETISNAINREAQIKNMHRIQKIALIVAANPTWRDLSLDWGKPTGPILQTRPPTGFNE